MTSPQHCASGTYIFDPQSQIVFGSKLNRRADVLRRRHVDKIGTQCTQHTRPVQRAWRYLLRYDASIAVLVELVIQKHHACGDGLAELGDHTVLDELGAGGLVPVALVADLAVGRRVEQAPTDGLVEGIELGGGREA